MYRLILGLYKNAGRFLKPDEAQNLTEYALCFTMIALGTVAGMVNTQEAHKDDQDDR